MSDRERSQSTIELASDLSANVARAASAEFEANPFPKTGRRSAPRLRLSLPARLVAVERTHPCILLNLSRTGAQVAIHDALREGEGAVLKCGKVDHFVLVSRSEFGLNALNFEEEIGDELVLHIRRYHENFEERERRALAETARKWVNGETDDERPI